MVIDVLQQVGLNEKEISVYLALLELGSQPASVIGKKSDINRSSTYLILDSLIKRGFVNQYMRADVKYFTAADPQIIVKSIKKQESKLKKTRQNLKTILPDLYGLASPLSVKPKVRFYEGEKGVIRAMEDTLTSTETLQSWDSLDAWFNSTEVLQDYLVEYGKLRVEKHKIPLQALFIDSPLARKYIVKDYPVDKKKVGSLLDFKWIPKEISPFNIGLNIYNDKVTLVSLVKDELLGVIIESHEIYKVHKAMFELAWKAAKKK
ncbi:TrmB family transcriptional regulator [Patescibacteria group bacterium]